MRSLPLTASIALVFVPLAFSEELMEPFFYLARHEWLVPASVLLPVDAGLLLAAFVLAWFGHGRGGRFRPIWFAAGALAHLGVDVVNAAVPPSVGAAFALAVPYAATLAVIGAAMVGAHWLPPRLPRVKDSGAFRYILPLVAGTLFAYLGEALYWYSLGAEPTTGARVINDEYFAQMSAVIPLLLIAIGFEARQFQRYRHHPAGRSTALVIIVLLCVTEILVLTVLTPGGSVEEPVASYRPAGGLPAWLEYPAFLLSLEAMCMGLALVAWALIPTADPASASHSPPDADSGQAADQPRAATPVEADERPRATDPPVPGMLPTETSSKGYPLATSAVLVSAGWAAAAAAVWWQRRSSRRGPRATR
ncbi:hypothetical protein [Phytohabitans kaempferiae]|uniref:Uncharacterized protein n=1 Tax=Phytohabitans kaempferiae TaxID=1620943 RepID=A0ABV6M5G2_9ACTN